MGEGGQISACEKHARQRGRPEKRPFKIRFGPRGVSIQTNRGTHTDKKKLPKIKTDMKN
jgi:hypothetical protein